MILEESLNNYWNSLEKKYPLPSYVKKVKELDFRLLKKAIDDKNITFLKKLIILLIEL